MEQEKAYISGNIDIENYSLKELKEFGKSNNSGLVYALAVASTLNAINNCMNDDKQLDVEKSMKMVTDTAESIMDDVREIITNILNFVNDASNKKESNNE